MDGMKEQCTNTCMCLLGIESRHSLTCMLVYLVMDKPVDKPESGYKKVFNTCTLHCID